MTRFFFVVISLVLAGCGSAHAPGEAAAASEGLPPGFTLIVFAEDIGGARLMAFGPDTTDKGAPPVLYVSSTRSGRVLALPDRNRDGRADEVITFAKSLRRPHGLAWRGAWLYVGETHRVIRLRDTDGDLRADERQVVVADLPAGGQHFTRTVGFGPAYAKARLPARSAGGPDGQAPAGKPDGGLYVSVGSSCNVCQEDDPRRAAITRYEPDGSPDAPATIYARGLRNSVGFTWHPETGEMWATNNGRDWLGDDLPPEELNLIRAGKDYGWPYCYGDRLPDPDLGSPERCAETEPPAFEMQAHSAPLGLAFYTGEMFPEDYRGDLFIAFHGSWNRSTPTGYKVVRVHFRDHRPVAIEDFVDVWFRGGRARHRPVDVKTGPEGALYISDDRGGTIFRVTYQN